MKKIIALLMTLALVISAAALPALAEGNNNTVDEVTTATRETGRGGPNGQQPPAMPGNGQNNQGGPNGQQPPAMPGNGQQGDQNGQQPPAMNGNDQNSQNAPAMPGSEENNQNDQNDQNSQDGQNGQKPEGGPGNGKQGGKKQPKGKPGQKGEAGQQAPGGEPEKRLDFEQLVKDEVITQEICEAILTYMKEHAPQDQPQGAAPGGDNQTQNQQGGNAPAADNQAQNQPGGNAPAPGSEPPAKPEGDQNAPEGMGMEELLLKELLDNSVITQEIYDLLLSMLTTDTTAQTAAAGA